MRHLALTSITYLVLLGGCGGKATPAATPAAPAAGTADGSASAGAADHPSAAHAAPLTAVVVVYSRMTYVMDSPNGQRSKAEAAVKASALVRELTGMGLAVTYKFDEHGGDDVVVTTPEGAELGRADLHDLEGKAAPAALVDAVRARTTP